MIKKYLVLFLVFGFLVTGVLYAKAITPGDLGVPDPGVLPTSPFYFFKEWGRGFRRLFIFNPVARVELELGIVNEKAAEAAKVEEVFPENDDAVKKALENYKLAHERLMSRLQALKETSKNPNVDKLLRNLVEKITKHEQLFSELEEKFKEKAELKNLAGDAKDDLERLSEEADKKKVKQQEEEKESKNEGKTNEEGNLTSATVNVTENGFAPREVKIKRGGKVTWINKGTDAVWPASAPHPVHTGYPGFDALRGLANGESYSFAFDKVGSWKYHNHLNPSMTGVVNVVE